MLLDIEIRLGCLMHGLIYLKLLFGRLVLWYGINFEKILFVIVQPKLSENVLNILNTQIQCMSQGNDVISLIVRVYLQLYCLFIVLVHVLSFLALSLF